MSRLDVHRPPWPVSTGTTSNNDATRAPRRGPVPLHPGTCARRWQQDPVSPTLIPAELSSAPQRSSARTSSRATSDIPATPVNNLILILRSLTEPLHHIMYGTRDWAQAFTDIPAAKNTVALMTIHRSKGLEYHTVFFLGLDEDQCVGLPRRRLTGPPPRSSSPCLGQHTGLSLPAPTAGSPVTERSPPCTTCWTKRRARDPPLLTPSHRQRNLCPARYSIEWLTCAFASRLDIVYWLSLPGAAQDRLLAQHCRVPRPAHPQHSRPPGEGC